MSIIIVKLAFFNAVGLCLAEGGTTLVDAKLTSHVVYGARHYPLGLWICWAAPIVFILSYVPTLKTDSKGFKIIFPSLILFIVGIASLFNFKPEFPHFGITVSILIYCLIGVISSWIHYFAIPSDWIMERDIESNIKIERIREYVNLWRTIAISIVVGYLALLIPEFNLIWTVSEKIAPKRDEIFFLANYNITQLLFVSLYVLIFPVWEAFSKSNAAADLMLSIKND